MTIKEFKKQIKKSKKVFAWVNCIEDDKGQRCDGINIQVAKKHILQALKNNSFPIENIDARIYQDTNDMYIN